MNRLLPFKTIALLKRRRRKRTMEVVTSVKIPKPLARAIKDEARRQDITQSQLLRRIIQAYVTYQRLEPKA